MRFFLLLLILASPARAELSKRQCDGLLSYFNEHERSVQITGDSLDQTYALLRVAESSMPKDYRNVFAEIARALLPTQVENISQYNPTGRSDVRAILRRECGFSVDEIYGG